MKIKNGYIYILSFGSDAVYKLDMSGKILETYPITPGKNPGVGNGGIEFDEDENIMVETSVDGYNDGDYRFYQIGPDGDEWKTNSYIGNITRDKKGFYFIEGVDWLTRKVQTLDRSGSFQKEFTIKLPQKAYVYYKGSDKEGNIYLDVGFEFGSIWDDNSYIDHFIWKYNIDGKLLTEIDRSIPLQELFEKQKNEILTVKSGFNGYYASGPINTKVSAKEDIYWMASFGNKGLIIFKYSKTE